MAVFTQLTKEVITSAIEPFGLPPLQSFKGFASGVENTTYGLMCDGATYVLTMFERRVTLDDIPFFESLLSEYQAGGINCPTILKDEAGSPHFFIDGKLCILQTFVSGSVVELPSPVQCELAGAQLGQMHMIAKDSALLKPNSLGPKEWGELLVDAFSESRDVWASRYGQIQTLYDTLVARWPENLPTGPVHADYFTDNVFFSSNGKVAVIDFFLGCTETLTYDLGLALVSWAFDDDGNISPDHMQGFLNGYQQSYKMNDQEKDWLPFFCKAAVLRILLTRLIDDNVERTSVHVMSKPPEPFWRRLVVLNETEKSRGFERFLN